MKDWNIKLGMFGILYGRFLNLLIIFCRIVDGKFMIFYYFYKIDLVVEMRYVLFEVEKVRKKEVFFIKINGLLKNEVFRKRILFLNL